MLCWLPLLINLPCESTTVSQKVNKTGCNHTINIQDQIGLLNIQRGTEMKNSTTKDNYYTYVILINKFHITFDVVIFSTSRA